MAYRNKTYVCFDGDTDMSYYRLMQAWHQNDRSPFSFYNAHDLNTARDTSQEESIKRQLSLAGVAEIDGLTPDQAAKVKDGAERAIAAFSRELVSSLHFYQAQPGALGIGEVVVTGGTAHMDGFAEAVGRLVGVPVRVGDPLRRVKVSGRVEEDQQGSLAVAIGLGIED